jgi:PAS domain S-box-containing protein
MDAERDGIARVLESPPATEEGAQSRRYQAYFAHSPLPIMVADAEGRYVEVNPAASQATGYDEAELLAMSLADLLAEESREAGRLHFDRVKELHRSSGELCWVRKDGTKRWSTCEVVKLSNDRFAGFFLDVTERRQTEEALRRSQAELRAIHDHAPIMLCVVNADRKVVYCNRAMSAFIKKSEEAVIGDRACGILGCINALDDPRGCGYGAHCQFCPLRAAMLDTFQTGNSHNAIDYRATLDQGSGRREVALLANTSLIQQDGEALLLLCLEDVTERMRTEEAIRESDLRFRALARYSPAGIYLTDSKGKCLYVNPRWCEMAGLTFDEAVGDGWMLGIHPDDRAAVSDKWARMVASSGSWSLEYRFRTPDGKTSWVWGTAAEIKDERGVIHGYVGTNLDITARKQDEDRLRVLAELLDASPTSTTVHDADGNFLYANEKTFALHGCSREEFCRMNLHQLDVPESEHLIEERLRQIAEQGTASFEVEHYRKGGDTVPLHVDSKLTRWGDRDVFLSVATDISELKRTERTLRERKAVLRAVLDAVSESVFLIDTEGIVLTCNETTAARFDKGVDALEGRSVFDLLPADIAASRWEQIHRVVTTRKQVQFEDSREGHWYEHTVYPVFNDRGDVVHCAVFSRDVSERKSHQDQLQLQSLVLNQIQDRVTVTDLSGVIIYVNDAECASLKRRRESLVGQPVATYGEDLARGASQAEILAKTLAQGEWRGEVVNRAADGAEVVIDCRTRIVWDDQGCPVALCGIGTDVTARRQAEESLRQSEARYRMLFESMNQGVFVQQADGRLVDVNPALLRMIGLTREEFLSRTSLSAAWDLVREDGTALSGPQHPSMVAMQRGQPVHNVVVGILNPRTNARVWSELSAIPEFQAGEQRPYRVLVTMHDITERRRAEQELRDSQERLALATKATNDVVWDWDIVHDCQRWNEAGTAVFGWADIVECPQTARWWLERVHPDDRSRVQAGFYAVLENRDGDKWQDEYRFLKADGDYAFVLDRGYAMRDERGDAVRMIGAMHDITESRRAEQEKLEMERRLLHAQKLESLGVLAGGIAHDFNNILAIIMGYADLLDSHLPESEPAHHDVNVIMRAVQRAAGLTQQMLAYAGKGKTAVESVNLSRLVEDARGMLDASISKKAVIRYELAADLEATVADASQIYQVVVNLIVNASEALGDDEGRITVTTDTVECGEEDLGLDERGRGLKAGRYVRLKVVDTGCGMAPQTLSKIFDPFFTTKFAGRGLGLAVVHGIVHSHGGAIRVASAPGYGTTFEVLLPVGVAPAPIPAHEPVVASSWKGSGVVLVVDDEEIIRIWARSVFEGAGFSVLTAGDGEEAVRVYQQRHAEIDCVLLDLTMPKLNGMETFRELRRIRADARVILSSGYNEEELAEQLSATGLAAFLQKPYRRDTLIATVRQTLEPAQ